ncbi:hypothetical protein S7711_10454 [Stachybotrys chartarum IBT 7711]|uniref:MARVEL domain-containing protein n=1 Tax=Stachybotrys chartarum (strain CBS 109288 / IBT 7711) TaxID=1280523 RepID=A0A084BBU7_STACB|nr:hypothetical protein S7711_10454 [Stachybotrys chartarum IBT 7711]KFA51916.1 hypothetical protein S40293_10781 [Stachybotrys chartarum IBT 40293]KFA73047.1 hypothetical protein S40288_10786 [Stachybotrys chartarum IBT 40288]
MAPQSCAQAPNHNLRLIPVFNFAFAFALSIASAHVNHKAFPSVGLVPAFTSAVGSFHIYRRLSRSENGEVKVGGLARACIALFDMFHASLMLTFVVLTWVTLRRWDLRNEALLAYATFPLIIGIVLHSYLLLAPVLKALVTYLPSFSMSRECPHCNRSISVVPTIYRGSRYAAIPSSPEAADLYTDDHSDDAQPIAIRPSFDEAAEDKA